MATRWPPVAHSLVSQHYNALYITTDSLNTTHSTLELAPSGAGVANNAGGAADLVAYTAVKMAEFKADNTFTPSASATDVSSVSTVGHVGFQYCSEAVRNLETSN